MNYEKKFFGNPQNGGGDFDSAFFSVGTNNWVNAENVRTLTTDAGEVNTVESVGSTILLPNNALPAGINIEIGSAPDEANDRFLIFNWNSNGDHGIYCYDITYQFWYVVLLNSQVTGGFNFDKNKLIHSCKVVNGCLYWVNDEQNEPRRINIDAGIKMNITFPKTGSSISFGYLVSSFAVPSTAIISYGQSLQLTMIRTGTGGSFAAPTRINIPLDWSGFPTQTAPEIIELGINLYLATLSSNPINFTVHLGLDGVTITVRILTSWDFGTGDPLYAPTTNIDFVFNDSDIRFPEVKPYVAPLSQSVISWIRRQPGLPLLQVKVIQYTPPIPFSETGTEAFLFAYRYVYRDFELSTLSGFSTLTSFNSIEQFPYNRIDVSIPFAEKIDQDVIQIDVVALYLLSNVAFIIKSWRKDVPSDLVLIQNHNAGIPALLYSFYNDQTGIALDAAYTAKLFDSLPIFADTMEVAKNRSFIGDYIIGYDTPVLSSLAATTSTTMYTPGGSTSISGEWQLLSYIKLPHAYSHYVLRTNFPVFPSDPINAYFYYIWTAGTTPPFPASVGSADLLYMGGTDARNVAHFVSMHFGESGDDNILARFIDQGQSSVINPSGSAVTGYIGRAFKSYSSYQLSISFKDDYGRESGVYSTQNLTFNIPDALGVIPGSYVFTNSINWTLNNSNALSEIPEWAYYFSVNITKCLRTRFFQQAIGTIIYAVKDSSNEYTFTTTTYASNLAGVAIDLTILVSYGQGYVISVGDEVRLFISGSFYNLSIIDQSGQYIICQLADVGILSGVEGQFEIFTPYKRATNEPYFEVNQIYQISNPKTSSRQYSSTDGTISGDIYLLQRQNGLIVNITETMSPNDKFYLNWFTDAGRPNFVDYIGRTIKVNSFCFSNTFIPGSQNNGLSTFDALDTRDIFPECGPLRKLQLTSKVQGQQGTIMLAICEEETASMYLSETQMVSADANEFLAQATGVVGTINVLKGSFGTSNPESVVEFRGNVFWIDMSNGKIIQYSANGLFPISNYKATRFWKLFCLKFLSLTQVQIESMGSRPFVFMTVDPHNWELLVSIPKLSNTPPKGYLPDYPEMIYPFDILDYQAKCVVYKLNAEPNHWQGAYNMPAEGFVSMQNSVFAFKNGQGYQCNSITSFGNFFGVQYKSRIMFVGNQVPNRPKVYNTLSVEGNMRPSLTYFRTEPGMAQFEQFDLSEQASDLMDFDFDIKEGNLYATIYRNKLQPTATGMNFDGLLTGEKIRALTLLVLIEFAATINATELRFVNLGYQISAGHST